MSTGTTAGPFYLTYQVQQTFGDTQAQWGQTSDFVQIQNSSGFVLQVTSGGDVYTIQPLTTATIPTQDGKGITVYPGSIGAQQTTATIYLVWLLPGQNPPMSDGPISPALAGFYNLNNFQNVLPLTFSKSGPAGSANIVTLPLVGSLPYVLVNFTITSVTIYGNIVITGVGSGKTVSSGNLGVIASYSLLYTVQPGDTAITISTSWYTGSAIAGIINSAFGLSSSQTTPSDVVPYGGSLSVSVVTTTTTSQIVLPAPQTGFSYRIHSVNLTGGSAGSFAKISVSGSQPFCTIVQGGTGFVNLGGRIVNAAVVVQNTATGSAAIEIGYDIIQTPVIN